MVANKHERDFKNIWAYSLLLLPVILFFIDGMVWRKSISDYAYIEGFPTVLPTLLTFVGAGYIFDFGQNRDRLYNLIVGIALIGVGLTPHNEYTILHYTFASFVFVTPMVTMILFSRKGLERSFRIIAAIFMAVAMIIGVVTNLYSILVAEWIGMIPMAVRFAGESNKRSYFEIIRDLFINSANNR